MGLKVRIITPEGKYLSTRVDRLNIKTMEGYLGIMQGHLPMVAILDIAPMSLKTNNKEKQFAVSGGILNITAKEAIVLVDTIESKDEINLERAISAKERALERIESTTKEVDIVRAELALKRAIARIKVKGGL